MGAERLTMTERGFSMSSNEDTPTFREIYLRSAAHLLKTRGKFVVIEAYPETEDPDDLYPWEVPGDYSTGDVVYSWADWNHTDSRYGDACAIVSIDTTSLREKRFSQFQDTFSSNADVAGLEMKATCSCGTYIDRWLRWEGSLEEAISIMSREES